MQFSNVEINYDLPWNPTRLEQRMGRIHRIGQKRKAFYYNFILDPEKSIDGYILSRLFDKIKSIKEVLKDKVYDVIGKLVDEDDIIKLYEELLKAPREEWEAKIKDLERSIDEKSRILEDINRLLSANKLDRTKLEDMRKVIKHSVDNNEVKRFVEVFIDAKKGCIERINDAEEFYRIYLPRGMAYKDKSFEDGCFLKEVAMSKGSAYFGLGNRFVMLMVNESRKNRVSILKHKTLKGLLLVYMLRIKDSKGRERAGKVVTFLVNDGQVNEIDPRSIWDFECSNDKPEIDTSTLIQTINTVNSSYITSLLDKLHTDTRKRLDGIKEKTLEVIENYYSTRIGELTNKIENYKKRLTDAPHFTKLIKGKESEIDKLREEFEKKRRSIEDEFETYPVVELVGIAEVTNEDGSDLRRDVELAGMYKVLEYEKKRASSEEERRMIKDVSNMLTGYDIESFDRVIEVKSFKESGAIELTSHEWLTANKMGDEYWVYVVEDALGEGKITQIQNPAERFKDRVNKIPITDYRYIIEDWKGFNT